LILVKNRISFERLSNVTMHYLCDAKTETKARTSNILKNTRKIALS